MSQFKAMYFKETGIRLEPNASNEDYNTFVSWLKTKQNDPVDGKMIKPIYTLLTDSKNKKRTKLANEVLRQVVMNNPLNNNQIT